MIPSPRGATPWVLAMRWHDLVFLHWPMAPGDLQPLLPRTVQLDLLDRQAWISLAAFHMTGVRPRWMPSVPGLSAFPELNVRTYVTAGGCSGVWFFSLDAGNRAAVRFARWGFGLPYYDAEMAVIDGEGRIRYESTRTHRGAPPARFSARYWPTGDQYRAQPEALDEWLTERYCLFTTIRGVLYRGDIQHEPWPLQPASADVEANTMVTALGLRLPGTPPVVHFAKRLDVVAWWPRRVG